MKKKGSALIVAMLLIAGVGAVAFGIGRLLFVETTTATLYENGIVAYYAAESGMEEGFLRYKFDRNAAVPALPTDPAVTIDLNNQVTNRTDLGLKTTAPGNFATVVPVVAADKTPKTFYDLHINYLGTDGMPWYGGDTNGDGDLTEADLQEEVAKDSSAKVDLTSIALILNPNSNKLMLLFEGLPTAPTDLQKCQAMAEIKMTVEDAGITREFKELTNYSPVVCAGLLGFDQSKLLVANPVGSNHYDVTNHTMYYLIDLKDMFTRAGYTFTPSSTTPVTLSVRPLYYNAKIGLYSGTCNSTPGDCTLISNIIPGPFTSIKSVGYYGGVTRTLTANVDRQSGTLYDLFDYVIFKEN